jgi:hypothetical protein
VKEILLVVAVWGGRFRKLFLDYHLASLLAPDNLAALKATGIPIRVLLYMTQEDVGAFQNEPAMHRIKEFATLDGKIIAPGPAHLAQYGPGDVMAATQRMVVEEAWKSDAGLIFNYPDTVYSEGSLKTLGRIIAEGKRAALYQGVCTRMEDTVPLLDRRRKDGVIEISGRDLVKMAIGRLHQRSECRLWNAPSFTTHPSIIYWPLADRGWLMRAWHLSPAFVYPKSLNRNFRWSLDGDYIDGAGLEPGDCAFLTDSDDFFGIEICPQSYDVVHSGSGGTARIRAVANWMRDWAPGMLRHFGRERFWFHTGIDKDEFELVAKQSDAVVREAEEMLARDAAASPMRSCPP